MLCIEADRLVATSLLRIYKACPLFSQLSENHMVVNDNVA
eukprot:UN07151